MSKKWIVIGVAALGLSAAGITVAFSGGDGNSATAPGQANAKANCVDVIAKQNVNGQTGAATGSASDTKQLKTAVTNCDKFWALN